MVLHGSTRTDKHFIFLFWLSPVSSRLNKTVLYTQGKAGYKGEKVLYGFILLKYRVSHPDTGECFPDLIGSIHRKGFGNIMAFCSFFSHLCLMSSLSASFSSYSSFKGI